MFYIVALGNPGEKYAKTRHNVGWQALDYCIKELQLPGLIDSGSLSGRVTEGTIGEEEVRILYPDTYMNNSGVAVAKLVPRGEKERLIVVHDEIDLPFGEVKVGIGRGAGGNKGVQSIIKKVDTKEFIRIRVGIAPKSFWTGETKRPEGGGPLERFVLKPFSRTERKQLPEVFTKVKVALKMVVGEGIEKAMNQVN